MGLVGTIQGRLGWAGDEARKLIPDIDNIIREAKWLESVDFDTIHYVMRFGSEAESKIICRRNRKHQELEVSSQLSMQELHDVFLDREKLRAFICAELARVFDHLKLKYKLPSLPALHTYLEVTKDA